MIEACRQCGSTSLKNRGPISRGRFFAGHALSPVWPGGRLYECKACALVFRHPISDDATYERLYATAPESVYASTSLRHDQELARAAILARHARGSVLDVGCFDGALLDSLGQHFEKYGVEASRAAADVCKRRGIDVVAPSIRDLPRIARRFDAVCAVDVIEHVADPLAFLRRARDLVHDGGSIVISTGNADARAWRAFGGRYWYCSFPEHISFVSATWIHSAAAMLDLDVVGITPFRHRQNGATRATAAIGFLKRLGISTAEYSVSALLPNYRRLGPRYVLGFPGAVADHMLAILAVRARPSDEQRFAEPPLDAFFGPAVPRYSASIDSRKPAASIWPR
jgi:SAM-dependent methyltransferase